MISSAFTRSVTWHESVLLRRRPKPESGVSRCHAEIVSLKPDRCNIIYLLLTISISNIFKLNIITPFDYRSSLLHNAFVLELLDEFFFTVNL